MRTLGRVMFVIALVVSGVITWLNLSWKSLEQLTNSPSEARIDYYLSDFTLTSTDETGNIRYRINGRYLTHQQADGASEIYQPHIQARSESGEVLTVDADKALQKAKNDSIALTGEIQVHQAATENSPEFTLTTKDLIYNPQQRLIATEAEISLISSAGTLKGTGFETSLDEQELRILSNVQAVFQAPQ